jgi:hypothetical protein
MTVVFDMTAVGRATGARLGEEFSRQARGVRKGPEGFDFFPACVLSLAGFALLA